MSQMLNQGGVQNQGGGFHGNMTSSTGAGLTSSVGSMAFPSKPGGLGLGKSSPYGPLSGLAPSSASHLSVSAPTAGTPILGSSSSLLYRPSLGVERGASISGQVTGDSHNGISASSGLGVQPLAATRPISPAQEEVPTEETDAQESESEMGNLANTKEKTPMCLINELARYNKVAHQYTLVDEQGPAHKKTFFVKLKLGEEEYSAQGESIKKAQHAAAAIALASTKLSHPTPKPPRYQEGPVTSITPTVELNALAMKRGEPAVYKLIEPRNQQQMYPPPNIDFRGMYNQRYHYGRAPRPFYVMLKVGQREFIGDGPTRQAARHCAASKALRVLKPLPMPSEVKVKTETEETEEDAMKSEISLVHEIALKRNLPVSFEVTRESGPPHMKTFVTHCQVGELTTEAEGNSKKLSKKRAAQLMLEELRKLPALPVVTLKPKVKPPTNKKKNRNIIKVQKADPSYGVGVNPISRLIQIMQAQKKKEPVYTLLAEKGLPRRREFVMQCQVDETISQGVGPNKKLAKRNAAESMLQMLGFSRPSPQPSKPAIKSAQSAEGSASDKKVTFVDSSKPNGVGGEAGAPATGTAGCQVVPGLLRLNPSGMNNSMMAAANPSLTFPGGKDSVAAVLAKAGPRPEQQIHELATHLNVTITFEEFSKSNSAEFLTRLTLSTVPPQQYHGAGPTLETSRDAAALCAIQTLLTAAGGGGGSDLGRGGAGDAVAKKEPGTHAMKKEPGTGSLSPLPHRLNSAGDQM